MFERPHHQRIALLLGSLDAALLREAGCLFGGGTAMALRFGEYRESVDVDFLVSDEDGYKQLRQLLRGRPGIAPIVREGAPAPEALRDVRADQYGIRTRVGVSGVAIKFEIVREGRIVLDAPAADDQVCGVATLSRIDMVSCKLLANSDRGLDGSTFNRDLIDLAMMAPERKVLESALAKAEAAYGQDVRRDFTRAQERLATHEGWLERCMQAMAINLPKAVLWQRLRSLDQKLERL